MDSTVYLVVGYGLTWGVLAWYVWRLERRGREARRALERWEATGREVHGSEAPRRAVPPGDLPGADVPRGDVAGGER